MSIFRDVHAFHRRMNICGPHSGRATPLRGAAPMNGVAKKLRELKEQMIRHAAIGNVAAGRFAWLFEELAEAVEAHARNDMAAEVDARLDLIYFAAGDIDLMDIAPDDADRLWAEVHRANMAKAPQPHGTGPSVKIRKPAGWMPPRIDAMVRGLCERSRDHEAELRFHHPRPGDDSR